MRRKLAAGNWKMNGSVSQLDQINALKAAVPAPSIDLMICPPATLLAAAAAQAKGHDLQIGGQDCRVETNGAFTGDIAAPMLADSGASAVILGHSERREGYGETDALVADKASAAIAAGLTAIVCLGESLEQREGGETLAVITEQLSGSVPEGATAENTVIAYEPIWAIGTGKVPTLEQIAEVHALLRSELVARFGKEQGEGFRLLYGGSVKPNNAAEIFTVPDVDGALVGGASLKADDFLPIIEALSAV